MTSLQSRICAKDALRCGRSFAHRIWHGAGQLQQSLKKHCTDEEKWPCGSRRQVQRRKPPKFILFGKSPIQWDCLMSVHEGENLPVVSEDKTKELQVTGFLAYLQVCIIWKVLHVCVPTSLTEVRLLCSIVSTAATFPSFCCYSLSLRTCNLLRWLRRRGSTVHWEPIFLERELICSMMDIRFSKDMQILWITLSTHWLLSDIWDRSLYTSYKRCLKCSC